MRMRLSVGIFAHNEQETVGAAIDAFLAPTPPGVEVAEILIVCCACVDDTVRIAGERSKFDARVKVVERDRREGKVAAINTFLKLATGEVLVITGGDIVPGLDIIERLVEPMHRDPGCAMTGGQVVAAGARHAAGRFHDLLWRLHHEVARREPKLGETIAVRRALLPATLPSGVHCDEVLIEAIVSGNGGRLAYVPEAQVRNRPPADLGQMYRQRRRIACQHASARAVLRYRPATERPRRVLAALAAVGRTDRWAWLWLPALMALEAVARVHGATDYLRGYRYNTWGPVDRLQPAAPPPADQTDLVASEGRRM
jgi:cellulose synthase/poly-beta-1,6-N-acetylglucosamine synthase-like glycosyltransferase